MLVCFVFLVVMFLLHRAWPDGCEEPLVRAGIEAIEVYGDTMWGTIKKSPGLGWEAEWLSLQPGLKRPFPAPWC